MHKKTIIKTIRGVISEWGSTSSGELQLEASPLVNNIGDFVQLAERYNHDGITAITYNRKGDELDEVEMNYEDLSRETLLSILDVIDDYNTDNLKTEKRCSN